MYSAKYRPNLVQEEQLNEPIYGRLWQRWDQLWLVNCSKHYITRPQPLRNFYFVSRPIRIIPERFIASKRDEGYGAPWYCGHYVICDINGRFIAGLSVITASMQISPSICVWSRGDVIGVWWHIGRRFDVDRTVPLRIVKRGSRPQPKHANSLHAMPEGCLLWPALLMGRQGAFYKGGMSVGPDTITPKCLRRFA